MSTTLPTWLFMTVTLVVAGATVAGFALLMNGTREDAHRAARRLGIALDARGAERVAGVRRRTSVAVPVGMVVAFGLVAAVPGADAFAATAAYGLAAGVALALVVHTDRLTADGPRVTLARTSRVGDLVHPAVLLLTGLQLVIVAWLAGRAWPAVSEDVGARVGVASVLPSAIVLSAVCVGGAAWLWKRPWRATDVSDLTANVAARALVVTDTLFVLSFLGSLASTFALVRAGSDADARFASSVPLALAALAPSFVAAVVVDRHARGLGRRLGLPWPPPPPLRAEPGSVPA